MTASFSARKRTRLYWALLVGLLVTLLVATAWARIDDFPMQRQALIRFYYSITQRIDIGDAGVLSAEPCSAPCVFGIRAGETQFDEVPSLLEKYGVSKCLTEPNVSWVAISCGMGRFNVQASTHTNLVNGIWFYPNDRISLGEIVGKYGEPDYVSLVASPEPPTIKAYLYWDSLRMAVVMPPIESHLYVLEKKTRVELIGFSDEELHRDSSEIEFGPYDKHWNGYGAYQP
ncbi:MAG TPA: hypothetical protein VN653_17765 [Anaerolineales bacterium]|nr:hypothetical protein [Anaerolineales bacterium]